MYDDDVYGADPFKDFDVWSARSAMTISMTMKRTMTMISMTLTSTMTTTMANDDYENYDDELMIPLISFDDDKDDDADDEPDNDADDEPDDDDPVDKDDGSSLMMMMFIDALARRYQFGLSLICAGKYPRALLVLDECAKMQPKNYQVTN